jgi:cell division transport system permease protein
MMVAMGRFLVKIVYLLQETFLGLRRGGWLNWAAVSTLTVLLFLVGISLELSWNLDATVASLGSQVEISVYLDPGVKGTDLQPKIKAFEHVTQVNVIPKEKAWRDLLVDMGIEDAKALETQLEMNPLVDALRLQTDSTEAISGLVLQLKQIKGIDEVYYGDQVVKQLSELQDTLKLGSLLITGVLTLATVAVITTTIRLIVMARRREIEVMQLVGATAVWIYLPFVIQGALFGLIGSTGAWGLILGSQQVLEDVLSHIVSLPFLKLPEVSPQPHLWILPATLLGMGLMLGTTSSLIAVRKSANIKG